MFLCSFFVIIILLFSIFVSANNEEDNNNDDTTTLFGTLSLSDDKTSVCLDSVPLNTCLFGTRYSYKKSQKFVKISIFRHTDGHSCAESMISNNNNINNSSALSFNEMFLEGRMTLTIPVGFPYSLREFLSHHNHQVAAHHHRAINQFRNQRPEDHDAAISSEDFMSFRNFGRGITSTTLFGSMPYDEDAILIDDCSSSEKNSGCNVKTYTSRHRTTTARTNNKNNNLGEEEDDAASKIQRLTFSSAVQDENDAKNDPKNYQMVGFGMYCVALLGQGEFALEKGAILKHTFSSNEECLEFNNNNNNNLPSSFPLVWQIFPVGIHSEPLFYSVVFYQRSMRIVKGNKISIVSSSSVSSNNNAGLSCLQFSYLNNLYCHSCGGQQKHFYDEQLLHAHRQHLVKDDENPLPKLVVDQMNKKYQFPSSPAAERTEDAEDEKFLDNNEIPSTPSLPLLPHQQQISEIKTTKAPFAEHIKNQLAHPEYNNNNKIRIKGRKSRLIFSSDHHDSQFFSHRWSGPCPIQTIDNSQRVSRKLNYELDHVCRPATCVNFVVFHELDDCRRGSRFMNATKSAGGKLLTLQCGSFHDKDSTAGLMHNVFLSCNKRLTSFQLYGECGQDWCKAKFSLPSSRMKNIVDASTCVKVPSKLLTNVVQHLHLSPPSGGSGSNHEHDRDHDDDQDPDSHFYVSLFETGVDCSSFGVKVLSKAKMHEQDQQKAVLDTDWFVSDTCIPLHVGNEPRMEPVCVDWASKNKNRRQKSSVIKIHFDLENTPTLSNFTRKLRNLIGEDLSQFSAGTTFITSSSSPSTYSNLKSSFSAFEEFHDQDHVYQSVSLLYVTIEMTSLRHAAILNSLSQLQLRSIGVVSFSFEGFPFFAPVNEETDLKRNHHKLPKFILPKSYRINTKNNNFEEQHSNDNQKNTVGPFPWRLNKKNSSLMKKIKLYVRTENDDDVNNRNDYDDEDYENNQNKRVNNDNNNNHQQRVAFPNDDENAKFVFDTWIGGISLVIFVAFLFAGYKLYNRYFRRTPPRSTSKIIKEINQNNALRKQ